MLNQIATFMVVNDSAIFGLGKLKNTIIDDWLGPLFLVAIAVFAIVFIKDRAWMKLIGFVGIAAIVGVLIFAGDGLFNKDGAFVEIANNGANQIGEK